MNVNSVCWVWLWLNWWAEQTQKRTFHCISCSVLHMTCHTMHDHDAVRAKFCARFRSRTNDTMIIIHLKRLTNQNYPNIIVETVFKLQIVYPSSASIKLSNHRYSEYGCHTLTLHASNQIKLWFGWYKLMDYCRTRAVKVFVFFSLKNYKPLVETIPSCFHLQLFLLPNDLI